METKKPTKALVRLCRFLTRFSKRIQKSQQVSLVPAINVSCCLADPIAPRVPVNITPTYLTISASVTDSIEAVSLSPSSPRAASYPPTPDYIKLQSGDLWSSNNSFFPSSHSDYFNDAHEELGDVDSLEPRDWAIAYEDLEIGHKIQSNATGDIHRGRWHGNVLVYKHRDQSTTVDDFLAEVEKLSKIRHENILLFLGAAAEEADNLTIVIQPPKTSQSLHQVLNNPRRLNKLPASLKWSTAHQLAQAISYLHAKDVCVGNSLHSGNVFLESKVKLSLIDFGFGPDLFPRSNQRNHSYFHLAPELQRANFKTNYSPQSDSYAFGSLLYELFAERKPFQKGQQEECVDRPEIPAVIQRIISQCWSALPEDRPSFPSIVESLRKKLFFLSRHSTSHPDKLDIIGSGKNAFVQI